VDWEIFWQPNMKVIWKDGATFRSVNSVVLLDTWKVIFTRQWNTGNTSLIDHKNPFSRLKKIWNKLNTGILSVLNLVSLTSL